MTHRISKEIAKNHDAVQHLIQMSEPFSTPKNTI